MPSPEEHAAARKRIAVATAAVAADRWERVDPDAISLSWSAQLPTVTAALSAAQFAVADEAEDYLDEYAPPADVMVDPSGFSGQASDGGGLAMLLYQPAITALMSIGSGADVSRALAGGRASLDMIVRTQVADAGRAADQAALTARPSVQGYVRQIVGATCSRCTILAGRFYRWNAGFQRHPRCDCIHIATNRAQWRETGRFHDPQQVYDSLSVAERQRAGWSLADQKAIAAGADLTFVTNMKGVTTAGTRRSLGRMTPDQIYKRAGNNRDEAIRLLRQNGYLRGAPVQVNVPKPPTAHERLRSLAGRQPSATRQLGGGQMGDTQLLDFDGALVVEKIYGRRVPGTAADVKREVDAEQLGARVLDAVGVRAPAVVSPGPGRLLMEYLDGEVGAELPFSVSRDDIFDSADGRLMGLGDFLMGNIDRNSGNWMRLRDGRLAGIDHGFAFDDDVLLSGAFTDFSGYLRMDGPPPNFRPALATNIDLDPRMLSDVRRRIVALEPEFRSLRRLSWHRLVLRRLDAVTRNARAAT